MNEPESGPQQQSPGPRKNWFADILFYALAGIAFLTWEPTKWLWRNAYLKEVQGSRETFREPNELNVAIGALLSIVCAVAVGYELGWVRAVPFSHWVSWGLVTLAGVFTYGYTTLYALRFKFLIRFSQRLWSYVDVDGYLEEPYSDRRRRSKRNNPAWFSRSLIVVGYLTAIAAGVGVFLLATGWIDANQADLGWLCKGVYLLVALIAVALWVISSGGSKVFFLVVGLACWFGFHAHISDWYHSLISSADSGNWGRWGYLPRYLAAILPAAIPTLCVGSVVHFARVRFLAAISGIALLWFYSKWTVLLGLKLAAAVPLLSPAAPWIVAAIEFGIFVAYIFPLCHIAITQSWVYALRIVDIARAVYTDTDPYRDFVLQAANLAVAGLIGYFGLTRYGLFGVTALAVLISYGAVGKLLDITGPILVSVGAALLAGMFAGGFYSFHVAGSSPVGTLITAVGTFVLVVGIVFPALYLLSRKVLRPFVVPELRDWLVKVHRRFLQRCWNLIEELQHAAEIAYSDKTPCRNTFLHAVNVFLTWQVCFLLLAAGRHLGLATWLVIAVTTLTTAAFYLMAGRALLRYGVRTIAFFVAAIGGYIASTYIFAAQPAVWGGSRFVLAIVGGLFGAAVIERIFPVVYLFVRLIVNFFRTERWLLPVLAVPYEWLWRQSASLYANVKEKYRGFQIRFAQARVRFANSYADFRVRWQTRKK